MEPKELIDNSARRFDIFNTVLGILLISLAGYIWFHYFLENNPIKIENYFILWSILIASVIMGLYFFIIGYTQMSDNYDLEKIIMQTCAIDSLKKLEQKELKKFDLDKESINKIKKYIKQKIKDLIKGFE